MRASLPLLLLAAVLGAASPALAQPTSAALEASKQAAVQSANAALEAFNNGKYEDALAGFQRADRTFHTPKFLLFVARSQAKLGKLTAAKASYESVLGERLPAYAQPEFLTAQEDARKELAALLPRIPTLRVWAGAGVDSLKLDGKAVASGQSLAADPGEHTISYSSSRGPDLEKKITLREGESRTHTVEAPTAPPAASSAPAAPDPSPSASAAEADAAAAPPRRVPAATYIAYGLGAAGLVAGGVLGGLTVATKSDYNAAREAAPVDARKVNDYARQGRAFSLGADIGFAAAILGAATGTIVWVVSSRTSRAPGVGGAAILVPGAAGVGVAGTF